jgi:hypothetical protein
MPLTRWLRFALAAPRAIGWRPWLVAAVLSVAWALANLFAHVTAAPPEITRWNLGWTVHVAHMVVTGLLLLWAASLVEHRQAHPRVSSYVGAGAVALLIALGIDFLVFYVLEIDPAGFSGNTPQEQAVHRVIRIGWLLLLEGGLVVLIYARLRIAQRTRAALAAAELERATTTRQVLSSRLSSLQAQVEPRFLFNALADIEALYDTNAVKGERMLHELIAYLRAALPRLRSEGSTLRDEVELVRAFLAVMQVRKSDRLVFDVAVSPELGNASFPPMVLLPLVDNALRHGLEARPLGGRIALRATQQQDRLRVEVADDGTGRASAIVEARGLVTLRERLRGLYADQASLTLASNHPRGIAAIVDVPLAIPQASD